MEVAIIVVNFNTKEKTEKCLLHLLKYTDLPFHIWVIDNGSTDGSIEMLRHVEIYASGRMTVIHSSKNLGYAGAVQLAYPQIPSRCHIAYVNSDLYVGPQWASRLCRHLYRDQSVAAVGPLVSGIGGNQEYTLRYGPIVGYETVDQSLMDINQKLVSARPVAETTKLLIGALKVVRNDAHAQLGGLDPGCFLGADDFEFSLRARAHGWKLLIALDTFAVHDVHSTFRKIPEQQKEQWVSDSWAHCIGKWSSFFASMSWEDLLMNRKETKCPPFVYEQYDP